MNSVTLGLVGVGYLGELHLQKLLKIPEVKLVGFFDPDQNRSKYLWEKYCVAPFAELSSLLGKVDACIVAAPTKYHYELGKRILLAGKHLLIEKPISESLSEAEELVFLSKKLGLILQVGHVERFNPAIKRLMSEVRPPFYFESRRESTPVLRALLTDVAMDLLIHDVDILLKLHGGEPKVVDVTAFSKLGDQWDFLSCWLNFGDGSRAFLMSSRISPSKVREIRVFGVKRCFSVDCSTRCFQEFFASEDCLKIESNRCEFLDSDPLLEEDRHFVRSITDGDTPLVPGEEALKALKVIHEIRNRAQASFGSAFRPGP